MLRIVYKSRLILFFLSIFLSIVVFLIFGFNMLFSKVEVKNIQISPPKNLVISQGTSSEFINLQWDTVEDAEFYTLYRSTSEDKNFTIVKEIYKNNFIDRDVESAQIYYYKLTSQNEKSESEFSNPKSGFSYINPPKLIATNGSLQEGIKIFWNDIKGAQRYALYRYSLISKKWILISDSLVHSFYIDLDVKRGENYYYKVKAYKNGIWSTFSKKDRGFAKLNAPKNLQVSEGLFSFIDIKWEKSKDAKYYTIYRAKEERELYIPLKNKIKDESYKDIYAVPGKYYYYKVKAFRDRTSPLSKSDRGFIAIKTPTRLMATDASKKNIIVSWEQEDDTELFDLYRSDENDKDYALLAANIDDDDYIDELVKPAVIYYYKVKAHTDELSSPFSESDSGYVDVEYPWGLTASDGNSPYYIDLDWKGADADFFKIYRAENSQGPFSVVDENTSIKTFRDTNISRCKDYYYKVQAVKNGIESRLSSWDSGYTKCGAFVDTFSGTGVFGDQDKEKKEEATYNRPTGIIYKKGFLYIADTYNHRIRMIIPDGQTLTLAGSGEVGSADGKKDKASFYRPTGIAIDSYGAIYIAEVDNHLIRKITPQGEVSVVAGSGKRGDRDGIGKDALFNKPYALAIDKFNNLYVTELGNHKIKKISQDGKVTTYAGSGMKGTRDGSLLYASFDTPSGIVIDNNANIYICDSNNNNIRIITKGGEVGMFAGNGKSGDADGKGVAASFNDPRGLAIDKDGNIYVADTGNHKIRMITKDGIVKTIAGSLHSGDKDGFEGDAAFFSPRGITLDEDGNIYITDFHAHKIRKVTITKK